MNQATKRCIEDLVHAYADCKDELLLSTLFEVIDGELRFQSVMTATSAVIELIRTNHKNIT